ncbi:MAG TPA: hypothetical protein VF801_10835 [Rhodocyclaceae bacterium]
MAVDFRAGILWGTAVVLMAAGGTWQASQAFGGESPARAASAATPGAQQAEPVLSRAAAGRIVARYLGDVEGKLAAWEPRRQSFLARIEHDVQLRATDMAAKDAEAFKDAAKAVQREVYLVPTDGNFSKEDDRVFDAASSAADDLMMADAALAIEWAVYAKTGHNQKELAAVTEDARQARAVFQRAARAAYGHFGIVPAAAGAAPGRARPARR